MNNKEKRKLILGAALGPGSQSKDETRRLI